MTPSAKKKTALIISIILLSFAFIQISSRWWAGNLCRLAAARLAGIDLRLDSGHFNLLSLTLNGRGGVISYSPHNRYLSNGDLDRLEIKVDLWPALTTRRLKSVRLEISNLTVFLSGAARTSSIPMHPQRPSPIGPSEARAESKGSKADLPFIINSLRLIIDKATVHYDTGKRRGEISVSLKFNSTYEDVRNLDELSDQIMADIATKAAAGFLIDSFFN